MSSGFALQINGNVTLPSVGGVFSPLTGGNTGPIQLLGTNKTFTSNAKKVGVNITVVTGSYTQADNFNGTGIVFTNEATWKTGNNNFTVGALNGLGTNTFVLGSSRVTIDGAEGNCLRLQSGTTIDTNSTMEMEFTTTPNGGSLYPTVIDLNGVSIGYLVLDYSLGINDSYVNSHYVKFNTSGTIKQIDVGSGVFMKGVAGITLTVTNCNIVGSASLPCSLQSETASSNMNLCITNQNIFDTNFQDVNATCNAIVDLYDAGHQPTLTRVTNITSQQKAAPVANAGLIQLLT